jgi:N-acylneuraminate cytidylyltransferase
MKAVIEHALVTLESQEGYRPEVMVVLQPTSPLRSSGHIDRAVEMLLNTGADSIVSVTRVPGHYHPDWQFRLGADNSLALWNGNPLSEIVTRRQDLPHSYTRNGAVYAFNVASFLRLGSIYGDRCFAFEMKAEDSINIDSEVDFALAERRIAKLQKTTESEESH